MTRLLITGGAVASVVVLFTGLPGISDSQLHGQRSEPPNLVSLFDVTAGAIRDTNGDGLADAVAARVMVPADPTVEDVQAATNIAARLGFEVELAIRYQF